MSTKDGGPAFPLDDGANSGMSLRDYFAGKTLVGFLAGLSPDAPYVEAAVARSCYAMADEMLKAREA